MKPDISCSSRKRRGGKWLVAALSLFMGTAVARAQENSAGTVPQNGTPPATSAAATKDTPSQAAKTDRDTKTELATKDTGTTFKLRVNLVQVRVVVRDAKGNLVLGLKREDFQVFDQGKLQAITTFGMETPQTRRQRAEAAAKTQQNETGGNGEGVEVEKAGLPERFVALVFDDIHLNISDAVVIRSSAKALIEGSAPSDRLAIYSTSGEVQQDFTADKAALERTLPQIVPRPKMGRINSVSNCPDVTHYMADQSLNKSDPQVLPVVAQETLQCMYGGDPRMLQAATMTAQAALQQALTAGDTDNQFTYRALEDVLRRMRGMPGERVLVLASPGFLLSSLYQEEGDIVERANRAGIVINTLDARGLYTPDLFGDISQRSTDTSVTAGPKAMYRTSEQLENEYVLADFAHGTGGTFFHNSNDLAGGLKLAGQAPELSYVLGFSPQNQKMDGKFHSIKVTLTNKQRYNIQARRGYYAPKKVDDPQEQAKQEIAEAVFSQEEIHELPLDLQTQYFKAGDDAHLSVVSHIDVKGVHFRKENGRNWDNLTVATVIFDDNGNYVTGGEKVLEMRLFDATYTKMTQTGVTMKSSFDLKPGKYLVRQVIRDSEGAQMAARNGAVVIPF